MSIGAVGSALTHVQNLQTHQVRTHNDVDGDNDGSRPGEVESAESSTGSTGNTGNLGTIINVKA